MLPAALPLKTIEQPPPTSPRTPGRTKTGTGSAAISSPSTRAPSERANITGFVESSFLQMVWKTGHVPPFGNRNNSNSAKSLEELRVKAKIAGRPIVVFPECTTSNGRGLLRFGNCFQGISVPPSKFSVFVMCARFVSFVFSYISQATQSTRRIDPPSMLSPTLSLSIPSGFLNPLSHIFSVATSPLPQTFSIRLLSPSDSPGSPSFQLSEFVSSSGSNSDSLSPVCATLMSDIGRMKQVGLGWEDKTRFFEFFKSKRN